MEVVDFELIPKAACSARASDPARAASRWHRRHSQQPLYHPSDVACCPCAFSVQAAPVEKYDRGSSGVTRARSGFKERNSSSLVFILNTRRAVV